MHLFAVRFSCSVCVFLLKSSTFAIDISYIHKFDAFLSQINQTNLTEIDWTISDDLFANFLESTKLFQKQLVQHLLDVNGLAMIQSRLNFIHIQNLSNSTSDQVKKFSGTIISLIELGSRSTEFCEKGFEAGLLDRLISFLVSPILFADPEFSHDFLGFTIISTLRYFQGNLALPSRALLLNRFGHNLMPIQNLLANEESIIIRLHFASLLAQKNITSLSQAELNQQFYIDSTQMGLLKAYMLASGKNYFRIQDYPGLLVKLKTSFFLSTTLLFSPSDLLRQFNVLLLSEPNRQQACDLPSLEAWSFPVSNFSLQNFKLAMYAIRGLFIVTQTCTYYQEFLTQNSTIKRKSAS